MLNRGKYSNALPVLDAHVGKNPTDVAAHVARGSALLALKKLPEAMEAYGLALALRPDLSLAHFGLGEVYRLLGDRSRAVRHFRVTSAQRARTAIRCMIRLPTLA